MRWRPSRSTGTDTPFPYASLFRSGGEGQGGARPGDNQRDPRGRETQGRNYGQVNREGVHIPDEMGLRRTREIVDELRRRRGERERPPLELDYLDRLLDQF